MRSTGAKIVPCGLPGIMFPKSVGLRNRDFVGRVTNLITLRPDIEIDFAQLSVISAVI